VRRWASAPPASFFGIAVVLPPVVLILGLLELLQNNRDTGVRLIAVAPLAAVVWVLLFVG
jgi:hypothetical protein